MIRRVELRQGSDALLIGSGVLVDLLPDWICGSKHVWPSSG